MSFWPRCIKLAFDRKSDKSNATWILTNQNRVLRTCVWFFWFAIKRKFYATGPMKNKNKQTNKQTQNKQLDVISLASLTCPAFWCLLSPASPVWLVGLCRHRRLCPTLALGPDRSPSPEARYRFGTKTTEQDNSCEMPPCFSLIICIDMNVGGKK